MTDTSADATREMDQRMALLTPRERLEMASGMFDLAREIILATLPADLPEPERRYQLFVRMYGAEF